MIPRLGDGNYVQVTLYTGFLLRLENDSPSRGRKLCQSNSNLETGWEV